MQAGVGRDSEGACSGQELEELWNALGAEVGLTRPKPQQSLSSPTPQAPAGAARTPAGRWATARAGSLPGSTRKPWESQRFACTSRRAAPPAPAACLPGAGQGCGCGGRGRGHPRGPCLPCPACGCLPHDLTLLTARACGSAGPENGPRGRGARGPGSLVGGWRARPCIYTLGPRLLS